MEVLTRRTSSYSVQLSRKCWSGDNVPRERQVGRAEVLGCLLPLKTITRGRLSEWRLGAEVVWHSF